MLEKTKSIFDPKYRQFIESLVAARKQAHLTQRQLAAKLGVGQCYIARIETHERRIDLIESITWMRTLGMSDEDIIEKIKQLLN